MRIAVEIAFSFKHALNPSYRELHLPPGATVRDAIDALASGHEAFRDRVMDQDGRVRRNFHTWVNGRNVRFADDLATVLVDGDRLSIVPPAGGG